MGRFHAVVDIKLLGQPAERGGQRLPLLLPEAERQKKSGLPPLSGCAALSK
jgi:hypothetical protein